MKLYYPPCVSTQAEVAALLQHQADLDPGQPLGGALGSARPLAVARPRAHEALRAEGFVK